MVYEKVKAMCDKENMSIGELERKSGLGNGTVRKWQAASPNLDSLKAVAKTLKVDVKKLIE